MLVNADMTAVELVMLARSVCDTMLARASEPFQHFTVSVVGQNVSIVAVKQ